MTFSIQVLPGLTQYEDALALQEQAVESVLNGGPQTAFFLEHPPVFTLGSGANAQTELLNTGTIPTLQTGRGGKTTYHGPGQRVVYVVRDLRDRKDIRAHITDLQNWLITSLADLNVQAQTTDDVGVWVNTTPSIVIPAKAGVSPQVVASPVRNERPAFAGMTKGGGAATPAKIAAIGVRVRKWVAFHGIALNVNPDLSAYQRIVPCGLNLPVTSLHALGNKVTMSEVDAALIANLKRL